MFRKTSKLIVSLLASTVILTSAGKLVTAGESIIPSGKINVAVAVTETVIEEKEAASHVKRLIYNLPKASKLTLNDKEEVAAVRAAYEDLSDEAKDLVTTLYNLEARENKLGRLGASHVKRLIYNLPRASNLTLDDKEEVAAVRAAYDELFDEAKQLVTTLYNLEAREDRILVLENERDATQVKRMIYNLPRASNLTLDDKEAVAAVRTAYEDLSDEAKDLVTTLYNLEARENRLGELGASHVKRLIYNLPKASDLTLDDKEAVAAVRAAYEDLSEEAQKIVTTISQLEARENRLKELENEDKYAGWKLEYEELFDDPLLINDAEWVRDDFSKDSPWYVDGELDENGRFFDIKGGEDFARHLDSFWMMRKRVSFSEDDWLTAELAARDYTKTGEIDNPVTFSNVELPNGEKAAELEEKEFGGGGLIRSTEPLPPEYRIEVKLKTIDYGGMRNGSFEYDGKTNGYDPEGVKTNYPWKRSGEFTGPADPSNENFADVRGENGYYFLSVVDYHDPAPHNNIFIHYHRKVNMDAYNVNSPWASSYEVTNPATGEKYGYTSDKSTRNGINALFMHGNKFKDSDMPYNEFIIETEAGTDIGGITSAAEIQPELMPDEDYLFAIEKTDNSYVMEMSGNFLYAGDITLRYEREFIGEDGRPLWHFNNRPDQYDGQYNQTWDGGEYKIDDTWPEGSAFPDYFILGNPHLNYYQGSAAVDDIKLYTPEVVTPDYVKTIVWQLYDATELDKEIAEELKVQLTEIEDIKDKGDKEKLDARMKEFYQFMNELESNESVTQKAHEKLQKNVESMIQTF